MDSSPNSQFLATDVFGLFGRGLVFRGVIEFGSIRPGDSVLVLGKNRTHSARVMAIELKRRLIDESVRGVELGLLLHNFDVPEINSILNSASDFTDDAMPPSPQEVLGLQFPLIIRTRDR